MSASSWQQPGLSPPDHEPVHGPFGTPVAPLPPPPPSPPSPPLGREIAWSVGAGLVVAALGAPLGLLWAALAPDVPVVQGQNGPLLTSAQPEQFVAADAWFTFLGVAFGIAVTVAAWFALRRYRGAIALAGVTLGAIGAALVAWKLGRMVGLGEYEHLKTVAKVGDHFTKPADLRAGELHLFLGFLPGIRGDLLAAPLAAAATYTLLAGWSRWPSLRPEPELPFPSAAPPAFGVGGFAPPGTGAPQAWPAGPPAPHGEQVTPPGEPAATPDAPAAHDAPPAYGPPATWPGAQAASHAGHDAPPAYGAPTTSPDAQVASHAGPTATPGAHTLPAAGRPAATDPQAGPSTGAGAPVPAGAGTVPLNGAGSPDSGTVSPSGAPVAVPEASPATGAEAGPATGAGTPRVAGVQTPPAAGVESVPPGHPETPPQRGAQAPTPTTENAGDAGSRTTDGS